MPAIPVPFVLSLFLLMFFIRLYRQDDRALRPAMWFIATCFVMVTVVGLRWSIDNQIVRFVQPIVASLVPAVTWFCFSGQSQLTKRSLLHLLPAMLVTFLSATWILWAPLLDLTLALLYVGYGVALLVKVSGGPDKLLSARLSEASTAYNAARFTGLALIFSGLVDTLIASDFGLYQGQHTPVIVAVANLLVLVPIAYAVVAIGHSFTPETGQDETESYAEHQTETKEDETKGQAQLNSEAQAKGQALTSEPAKQGTSGEDNLRTLAEDQALVQQIDQLLTEKEWFLDPDLTLNRLARKAGIPARQISSAINRVKQQNVSQVVNEYRIETAKRLLRETDWPVTRILFESGFQTKSNFNREFQRIENSTPSVYRRMIQEKLES